MLFVHPLKQVVQIISMNMCVIRRILQIKKSGHNTLFYRAKLEMHQLSFYHENLCKTSPSETAYSIH